MSALQTIALVAVCLAAALFVGTVLHRLSVLDAKWAAQAQLIAKVAVLVEEGAKFMREHRAEIDALKATAQSRIAELEVATGSRSRPPTWETCPKCGVRGETREATRHLFTCPYWREETRSIPAPPKTTARKS